MDELDRQIVTELQRDARQTNRQLAQRMGIAASTCFERVRRLHERGVIRGYHAEVDLGAIGRGVQALVFAQVRPLHRELIDAFQREASAMPEVMSVFVLAAGDDFLLHDLGHLPACPQSRGQCARRGDGVRLERSRMRTSFPLRWNS